MTKTEKRCVGCDLLKPIENFVTTYGYSNPRGKYCKDCFGRRQQEHAISLMEGRDFCLYCGKKIKKAYDWTQEGNSDGTYLHLDHMDPLSLGGENSDQNIVYCCVECNLRKGDKLFSDWLDCLEPKYREFARKVYIGKHRRKPKEFKPHPSEFIISIGIDL